MTIHLERAPKSRLTAAIISPSNRRNLMPNVFASTHPLVAHKVRLLRDKSTKPERFRALVREIAALMTYEATADLLTTPRPVATPLATAPGGELKEPIGLVPILRAGLGMGGGGAGLMHNAEGVHSG